VKFETKKNETELKRGRSDVLMRLRTIREKVADGKGTETTLKKKDKLLYNSVSR